MTYFLLFIGHSLYRYNHMYRTFNWIYEESNGHVKFDHGQIKHCQSYIVIHLAPSEKSNLTLPLRSRSNWTFCIGAYLGKVCILNVLITIENRVWRILQWYQIVMYNRYSAEHQDPWSHDSVLQLCLKDNTSWFQMRASSQAEKKRPNITEIWTVISRDGAIWKSEDSSLNMLIIM